MWIDRRDVVEVRIDGEIENHSVIVLSPFEVNGEEKSFLGVMISDSVYYDENSDYSFDLNNDMFTKPLKSSISRARLYVINFYRESALNQGRVINQMRIEPFKNMISEINSKVFGITIG